MSKKAQRKRIERLEALALSLKIKDANRRHVESYAKMSDEELASMFLAIDQFGEAEKEDPGKADELFRSGLAAIEYLDERGRFGWRAYCETGGQAAAVDFVEAHEDYEGFPSTLGLKGDLEVLLEGANPGGRRTRGIKFHTARLARQEPEQKKDLSENDPPSRSKEESV